MQPDWNELAKEEVKAEREEFARERKSQRMIAIIFGVFAFVIFVVVGAVQWFFGNPLSLKDIGAMLIIGFAIWVFLPEVLNFESRHEARKLRQIRIEKKLDALLSAQDMPR